MKKIGLLSISVLFFLLCSNITWGQIAAWNNNSLSGITLGSLNATTYDNNLNATLPSLSRGIGITATTLAGGYASSGWNVASEALAKSGNLYYQVTIIPNSGFGISLTSLDEKLRRTSSGPNNYIWSYSLNGSDFTDIGSAVSFTTTTTGGDVQPQIVLSSISDLQSVSGTIYLRLYAWEHLDQVEHSHLEQEMLIVYQSQEPSPLQAYLLQPHKHTISLSVVYLRVA